jgi:5-methylcytosine-specific restriction endonuclease McrA
MSKEMIAAHPFCEMCGTTKDLTTDHIIPLSDGGISVWSNLRVLCRSHNSGRR